jgi:pimeloyl-ACP methyl ester carboxylesterase
MNMTFYHRGGAWKHAGCAALAALLLATLLPVGGCGNGNQGARVTNSYTIKKNGVVIGRETVTIQQRKGSIVYTGDAVRPYMPFDSTYHGRIVASQDRQRLLDYRSDTGLNGVAHHTYVTFDGKAYHYLRNGLQTFASDENLQYPEDIMPLEPDSVASIQAVLSDRLASGDRANPTLTIVPSRNAAGRQTIFSITGTGRLTILVAGLRALKVAYDPKTGRVDGVDDENFGTSTTRDGAGGLRSKPFAPTKLVVKEVRVPTRDRQELAGSLYLPRGKPPFRAAVLLGDLGPEDRTGLGLLSQVADRLGRSGMAVLTCDRRGVPPSQGDFGTYTLETAVNDANSEMDYLFLRGDIDPQHMYMVGWGEGGVIAAAAAAINPYVSASVMMGAPSASIFPDITLRQYEVAAQQGVLITQDVAVAAAQIQKLQGLLDSVPGDSIEFLGHKQFLGWMRRYRRFDNLKALGSLQIPVLVLNGSLDELVPVDQARQNYAALAARGSGKQELVIFDGLGHEFGKALGEATSKPYRSHPQVAPRVLDKIANWLKEK